MALPHAYKKRDDKFGLPQHIWGGTKAVGNQSIEYIGGNYFLITNDTGPLTLIDLYKREGKNREFRLVRNIKSTATGSPGPVTVSYKGITYDGQYMYVLSQNVSASRIAIIKMDFNGNELQIDSNLSGNGEGIAYDGKYLYILDTRPSPNVIIKKIFRGGKVIRSLSPFSVDDEDHSGMTFDGKYLWVIEPVFEGAEGNHTNFKMVNLKGDLILNAEVNDEVQVRGIATDGKFLYTIEDD